MNSVQTIFEVARVVSQVCKFNVKPQLEQPGFAIKAHYHYSTRDFRDDLLFHSHQFTNRKHRHTTPTAKWDPKQSQAQSAHQAAE